MDPVWIKVFVLTLSECVAPAGKTVCQEQQIQMQFLAEAECEAALVQLIALKDQFDNTIVNRPKSGCTASARQTETYASLDEAKAASNADQWHDPDAETESAASAIPHSERLKELVSCEESLGLAPCKSGDIIVEAANTGTPVEIWQGAH